jgi:predicted PurR-regulated permease PerM
MKEDQSTLKKINPALIVAAYMIIIASIMYAASIVSSLLLAFFISIICAQPIHWMQKRKVPQLASILIVFVSIIIIFFGLGEVIGRSLSSFSQNVDQYEANLRQMSAGFLHYFNDKGINISFDKVSDLLNPSKLMGATASLLSQLGGFMGNTLTIMFLVLFLLLELDSVSIKAKAVFKDKAASMGYVNQIGSSIRHYLSIVTFTSFITGLLIWISLLILGVDYAILWGLIAFLLNYIPTIGSIIAAIPAILFSLIQLGVGGAFTTLIIFVIVNMVIGNVVQPKMMGKGMGLSTFIVFFSLLFWGFILGTIGMFLSVPLTMTIKIILEQYPGTKGIAVFLGTQEEAQSIIDNKEV